MYNPQSVLTEIGHCLNATISNPYRYQTKTAKLHGSGTDYVKALIKTAHVTTDNMTQADISYAQQQLDADLMRIFRYRQ